MINRLIIWKVYLYSNMIIIHSSLVHTDAMQMNINRAGCSHSKYVWIAPHDKILDKASCYITECCILATIFLFCFACIAVAVIQLYYVVWKIQIAIGGLLSHTKFYPSHCWHWGTSNSGCSSCCAEPSHYQCSE